MSSRIGRILGLAASAVLLFACASFAQAMMKPSVKAEEPVAPKNWTLKVAMDAAAAVVKPSVVSVETRFDRPRQEDKYVYWQYFRGARPLYGLYGTGFVYKDPQYIITCDFLLENAQYVKVTMDSGDSYPANVVGKDKTFHVAVLQVNFPRRETVPVPTFADSDQVILGQPMGCVGKSLDGVDTFATAGVISAIRKEIPNAKEPTDLFFQFDAAFELSYMGGPMIDANGRIIGMIYNTVADNLNLGTPINDILRVADKIIHGDTKKPWFGLEPIPVTENLRLLNSLPADLDYGLFISYVEPKSPCDTAGLKAGDVLLEINGKRLKYMYDFTSFARTLEIGQSVNLKYMRGGENYTTTVQVLSRPQTEEEKAAEQGGEKKS
jgi:S1-C subfamily serine protease